MFFKQISVIANRFLAALIILEMCVGCSSFKIEHDVVSIRKGVGVFAGQGRLQIGYISELTMRLSTDNCRIVFITQTDAQLTQLQIFLQEQGLSLVKPCLHSMESRDEKVRDSSLSHHE